MQTATTTDFGLLLGDFDRQVFFTRHFEQRSLHLRHDDPGRFSHLISHESFFEREIRRCGHLKASTRARDGWNQEVPIEPDQALKLFRAGMTLCATKLDERGPCGELLQAYRSGVVTPAPPHVNCYYSPDQAGYGLHFDTHPVWILQVAGSKHWTVSFEPAVRNPLFNVVFPPDRAHVKLPWIELERPDVNDAEKFMHLRLDPGDVLYIPAGGWHAARAEGSSLALTLAVGRVSTLDLFEFLAKQAVAQRLREVAVRLSPVPRETAADAARGELLARVGADLARLQDVVARMRPEDLVAIYDLFAARPELLPTQQFMAAKDQVKVMKALFPGV